jgi:hypothetical protein
MFVKADAEMMRILPFAWSRNNPVILWQGEIPVEPLFEA